MTRTTTDVLDGVDLTGRTAVVTGATTGLGLETARALAAAGAHVVLTGRTVEKADAAVASVRDQMPGASVEPGVVELGSLSSVRSFADELSSRIDELHLLVANAGIMMVPFGHTDDGFELQFGTNHLGHFLLTALLFPAVMAGDGPRIVNLSSAGHATSDVNLDDISFEAGDYTPWVAYGRSKTANALFSRGLAQRYGDQGLLSFAVHPGGIMTDLGRHLTDELIAEMVTNSKARSEAHGSSGGFEFKSVEAGAATQVWASVADLADCQLGVEGGNPNTTGFVSYLCDDATTDQLWTMSEELVGERYPPV